MLTPTIGGAHIVSGKYSDQFMGWLKEFGYTHCFYLAGGNVMHMLEAASHKFVCIPFVHEVGAAIAVDYFNESANDNQKAFLLVTAGPGLTNTLTGVAGAWTESRELLVIGGQAKTSEIGRGKFRQLGFQEIDGVGLCESITKLSIRLEKPISKVALYESVKKTWEDRKGPVFIEICLDVSTQEAIIDHDILAKEKSEIFDFDTVERFSDEICSLLLEAKRPIILIGGGVSRQTDLTRLIASGVPIATTFNGADRIGSEYELYAGMPNWYGSRWANLLIQQSDFILALGTRLGLMQVGYNWQQFAPKAKVIQVDIDGQELEKGFPKLYKAIRCDANSILTEVGKKLDSTFFEIDEWREFVRMMRSELAGPEISNSARPPYLEAMNFVHQISLLATQSDVIIPCSSGAAGYEGAMRVLKIKSGQIIVTSHAMASMGYGLSGAIGASLANPLKKVILFEGDGGFAQNMQELGTVKANDLNLKIFLMDNGGYQSIRGNQKSAFDSHYVGCDSDTGLFLPNWVNIANSFGLDSMKVDQSSFLSEEFFLKFHSPKPVMFVVKIDPEQTYWPRLLSSRNPDGNVVSNPLHLMHPPLDAEAKNKYIRYLEE